MMSFLGKTFNIMNGTLQGIIQNSCGSEEEPPYCYIVLNGHTKFDCFCNVIDLSPPTGSDEKSSVKVHGPPA